MAPIRMIRRARQLRKAMSLPEILLWRELRTSPDVKFRRQHPFGVYVLDFYCEQARLAVEIDGYSHVTGDRPSRDERRDAWLTAQGVQTLRLPAVDVLKNLDDTAQAVLAAARNRREQLLPPL